MWLLFSCGRLIELRIKEKRKGGDGGGETRACNPGLTSFVALAIIRQVADKWQCWW